MKTSLIVLALLLGACSSDIDKNKLIEKYTNTHSKFIQLDGNHIHYRDEGQGEVVLLLHGTASSLHTWDKWSKILSKQFRVIRMDLPGFGLTGPDHLDRYEVKDDIAFLKSLISELQLEKVHLVGSSLGGRIAWQYALENPENVMTLTLMNSLGYLQESWPPPIEMAQWPIMDKVMSKFSPRFLYEVGLKDVYADTDLVTDEVVDRYFELSRFPGNLEAFPKRVSATLDKDEDKIAQIKHPSLILWGQEDKYFPVKNAHRFKQDISNSKLITYPNIGHLPMEELSEKSATDFKDFIQGNK